MNHNSTWPRKTLPFGKEAESGIRTTESNRGVAQCRQWENIPKCDLPNAVIQQIGKTCIHQLLTQAHFPRWCGITHISFLKYRVYPISSHSFPVSRAPLNNAQTQQIKQKVGKCIGIDPWTGFEIHTSERADHQHLSVEYQFLLGGGGSSFCRFSVVGEVVSCSG